MNTHRIVTIAALVASLTQIAYCAESPSSSEASPVSFDEIITDEAYGCQSCGQQPRFTQYARPHAGSLSTDYLNPTPGGHCCRTVFGELICDIGHHLNRVVHGNGDILASTSADYCCETGCVDAIDCVPRLRDLVSPAWFYNLFGPPCGYDTYGCDTCGSGSGCVAGGSCLDAEFEMGEAIESMESVPTPADETSAGDDAPDVPDAPSMPVTSARLRAVTPPIGLSRPGFRVTRSQYTRIETTPDAKTRSPLIRFAGPQRPSSRQSPRLDQPEIGTGRRIDQIGFESPAVNASVKTHRVQRLVPPTPAIQFGDQFGKSARSRLRGATFR